MQYLKFAVTENEFANKKGILYIKNKDPAYASLLASQNKGEPNRNSIGNRSNSNHDRHSSGKLTETYVVETYCLCCKRKKKVINRNGTGISAETSIYNSSSYGQEF